MYEAGSKQLSQEDHSDKTPINSLLASAESVARGVLESIQATAGTTACKGVQIARLADWVKQTNCWIYSPDELGTFEDRGSENEVYLSAYNDIVYKLNDFRYADDNLTPFFGRVKAQNFYFPDCAYTLVGFAENKRNQICAVIQQPYIISSREATEDEISHELEKLGFKAQLEGEYFTNGIHDVFDATPNNVLVGIDGNLCFIDTIIYKSDDANVETYRSQSPYFTS